jgi:hypothetical protein
MWLAVCLISILVLGIFFSIIAEAKIIESLFLSAVVYMFFMVITVICYGFHNTDNADYEYIYDYEKHCHLTHLNYGADRSLKIEGYRFPERVEYEFSEHTFYRIDVHSHNEAFKSYWVDSENLQIEVVEGTIPTFKRITHKYDRNHNEFYDYVLPKVFMKETISEPMGILYVPFEPTIVYGEIPEFLEIDFLKYLRGEY